MENAATSIRSIALPKWRTLLAPAYRKVTCLANAWAPHTTPCSSFKDQALLESLSISGWGGGTPVCNIFSESSQTKQMELTQNLTEAARFKVYTQVANYLSGVCFQRERVEKFPDLSD
jgi:hypothetical protein